VELARVYRVQLHGATLRIEAPAHTLVRPEQRRGHGHVLPEPFAWS
jgi:hypothetical protein